MSISIGKEENMSETKLDLLYLSEPDMIKAGVNDVVACTDCMEELLVTMDKGDYLMGVKMPIHMEQ